jgi:cytoskeletal protein CcmA (bactofilin family)
MVMRRRHRDEAVGPNAETVQASDSHEDAATVPEGSVGLAPGVTIVGRGAEFVGTLVSAESIRIDGQVRGRMAARADVVLSSDSVVEADILAENVTVGGALKGTVTARGRTELAEGGRLEGGIRSKLLVVREGAVFSGRSSTGDDATGDADAHPSDELQTAYDQAKRRAADWYKTRLDDPDGHRQLEPAREPGSTREPASVPDRPALGHVTARRVFPQPSSERANGPWPDENANEDETEPVSPRS